MRQASTLARGRADQRTCVAIVRTSKRAHQLELVYHLPHERWNRSQGCGCIVCTLAIVLVEHHCLHDEVVHCLVAVTSDTALREIAVAHLRKAGQLRIVLIVIDTTGSFLDCIQSLGGNHTTTARSSASAMAMARLRAVFKLDTGGCGSGSWLWLCAAMYAARSLSISGTAPQAL